MPADQPMLVLVESYSGALEGSFANDEIAAYVIRELKAKQIAPLIDQVRERVEVVEEKVRIDLASEAFELRLQARLFHARAPQPVAFPVMQQEDRLVHVGDRDDDADDREERSE